MIRTKYFFRVGGGKIMHLLVVNANGYAPRDFSVLNNKIIKISSEDMGFEINTKSSHKKWNKYFDLYIDENGFQVEFKVPIKRIDVDIFGDSTVGGYTKIYSFIGYE